MAITHSRTGAFFELDGKAFGQTYAQLVMKSRAIASDARAFGYWAGSGGRFTPLAASHCMGFIKEAIRGNIPSITDSLETDQSEGAKRYTEWKMSFTGAANHWFRTGTLSEAVIVKTYNLGKSRMGVITIDPTVDIPSISFTGAYIGSNPAPIVAKWLELGTRRQPARPLLSRSVQAFLTVNFPKMVNMVNRAVKDWAKYSNDNYINPNVSQVTEGDLISAASSGMETRKLISRDVDQDFRAAEVKIERALGNLSSGDNYTQAMEDRFQRKETTNYLRGKKGGDEAEKWMKENGFL